MVSSSTLRYYYLLPHLLEATSMKKNRKASRRGKETKSRTRRSVSQVHALQGEYYFRRAHRMSSYSFWKLFRMLEKNIDEAILRKRQLVQRGTKKTSRNGNPHPKPPNGRIPSSVRLALALRYFAGGAIDDLAPLYEVCPTEVKYSIWYVVEAVGRHPAFAIEYPDDHEQQHQIARGFAAKSEVGFQCCAGAIDGVLVWIHRPTEEDCASAHCDPAKFFCARKRKFSLNCQAVSDCRGRILDISIRCPGSSSDLYAFEMSTLFQNLEKEDFLAPGLCLFGDNAYVNTSYMATPYPAVHGGEKDWYNFYHSQLRIRVECCFGILSQRWGLLRAAIPKGISLSKTVRLVLTLAKLHNFCISENDLIIHPSLAKDELNIRRSDSGSVPMEPLRGTPLLGARELSGAGDHNDDYPAVSRRCLHKNNDTLPRERMLEHVADLGASRPTPKRNRH